MNRIITEKRVPFFSFVNLIFLGFAVTLPLWVFQKDIPGVGLNLFLLGTLPVYILGPFLLLNKRIWLFHKGILVFFVAMHGLYINPNVVVEFSMNFVVQLVACLVFYVVFVNAIDSIDLYSRIIKVMLLATFVITAYLIYLYWFVWHSSYLNTILNTEDLYYSGRLGKNTLSFFLALLFPFSYSLFAQKKTPLNFLVLLVLGIGIFYTLSRMALLSMFFVVIALPLFSLQRRRYLFLSLVLLGLVGVIRFHYNFTGDDYMKLRDARYEEHVRTRGGEGFKGGGGHRERLLTQGVKEFLQHPLWGGGADSYRFNVGSASHNDYIQILSEFGLFGFLLFILIFALHFLELIRLRKRIEERHRWLCDAQLVALLNLAFMLNAINAYNVIPFWFIWAGCGVMIKIMSQRQPAVVVQP
ncbi:MAG: O-antigen ligase family protein [Deltaproteobacteria bacterium]|nr:O-antigen ligase family protein [Deltaproteobacteria bacterium]